MTLAVSYPLIVGRNILRKTSSWTADRDACPAERRSIEMKRHALMLAAALLLLTSAFISYRIAWLGYPIFPTAPGSAWHLSMDAQVKSDGEEMKVMIGLPFSHAGEIVAEERIHSGTFNFNLLREANQMFWLASQKTKANDWLQATTSTSASAAFRPDQTWNPAYAKCRKADQDCKAPGNKMDPRSRRPDLQWQHQGNWESPPDDRPRAGHFLKQHGRVAEVSFAQISGLLPEG
jgi:hypothetical protein